MKTGFARCEDCDKEFPAAVGDVLCSRCQHLEDLMYANDPLPVQDYEWKYSRPAMQERLGVTGKVDE